MDELSANFAEPALLQGRAAGVGQPFTKGRNQMSEVRCQQPERVRRLISDV